MDHPVGVAALAAHPGVHCGLGVRAGLHLPARGPGPHQTDGRRCSAHHVGSALSAGHRLQSTSPGLFFQLGLNGKNILFMNFTFNIVRSSVLLLALLSYIKQLFAYNGPVSH